MRQTPATQRVETCLREMTDYQILMTKEARMRNRMTHQSLGHWDIL